MPQTGLSRKASLNSVAAALDYGARLLVGFVINPLLVASLGAYGYGAWQVLVKLTGYLGPSTGRSSHALRWTINGEQTSTDYAKKRRYVGSALAVWFLFLPLTTILTAALAWWAPYWVQAPANLTWAVRLAVLLLGMNVMAVSLMEIPRSVLIGENLGYKRMGLSAVLTCFGGGLAVLAVLLDLGLAGLAAAALSTSCLNAVFFLRVTRKHVGWFGVAKPSFEAVRRFFGLSGWFIGWQFVLKLMRASDVVLLGLLAGVELVSTYSLTKYVPETIVNLVAIVVFGITPGLGGIIGAGDLRKAVRVRSELMALSWMIATVAGATILLWNRSFLQLWVGGEYDAGSVATLLIVLMVTQFVLIRNDANLIDLSLKLKGKVLIGLLSVTVSLVTAGILVGPLEMGIEGLCLGIIGGRLILSIAYPSIVGRLLGIPLRDQFDGVFRPALLTMAAFVLATELSRYADAGSWPALVVWVGMTLVVLPLPLFFAGLSTEVRRRIWRRLGHVVDVQRPA